MVAAADAAFIQGLDGFYDSLERGDVDAGFIAEFTTPDCELTSAIGSTVDGRTYRGHGEIAGWFRELAATSELRYDDRTYKPIGEETLLFLTTHKLKGKASGAEVSSEVGVVFEFEGGLVIRAVSYTSHEEAIAAAEGRRA